MRACMSSVGVVKEAVNGTMSMINPIHDLNLQDSGYRCNIWAKWMGSEISDFKVGSRNPGHSKSASMERVLKYPNCIPKSTLKIARSRCSAQVALVLNISEGSPETSGKASSYELIETVSRFKRTQYSVRRQKKTRVKGKMLNASKAVGE